ncbi:SAM-dependent methyltransferase [Psychromonas sp. MB-3u-54]|uniref:class I SAM-dependent methyltransferase n=1 Tax=Psychromonas sp. MB-3u-54 TaxID=2058319 RepID=UPI000C347304|nr:class I SAM-dependent methyltransferase [Psychromonas sp. MB-3u-54]PKH03659.1 SAM-dependent methyltransferase [Psychromonas sp. MB-3u-54]
MKTREKIVPLAFGNVLEVGMGSAVNMDLYNPDQVTKVWGLEPSSGMQKKAKKNLAKSPVQVEWLSLPGEKIPLEDNSVDSIVLTYTLCTIPDWHAAMKQMHRVLKPEGKILFCEHGQAPDESIKKWQNRLNKLWGKIFGGCHLNRTVIENIQSSGFSIDWSNSNYIKGLPKFASYISFGVATKMHNK